jgi:hypothetical protein
MSPDDIKKLPKYQVLRSLLNGDLCPAETMRAFDIFPHEVPLGGEVAAFVYRSRAGCFHVFVNRLLSSEARQEVFFHELYHIIEDMPRLSYVLGLDMQREEFEEKADGFFKKVTAAYAGK